MFSSQVCAAPQPDGIDLYVNACQNRGTNYTLLFSLYAEMELVRFTPHKTQSEIEAEARRMAGEVRRHLGDNHPRIKELTDIPATVASLNMQFNKPSLSRLQVMYRADDVKRRLMSVIIDKKGLDGNWERKSDFIEDCLGRNSIDSALHFPQQQEIVVEKSHTNPDDFINQGRLRGEGVAFVEAFFMTGTNLAKHEFAQVNIDKFRQEAKKQKATGKIEPFVIVGQTEYDGQKSRAGIVESKKNGIVAERFWIDASRGYVCPLVQYFDDKGKLLQEFKAGDFFLEQRSGLWFPALYTEFTAAQKGKEEVRKEYRIDTAKLKANFPVADEEFHIDVQDGVVVSDVRQGRSVRYKAFDKGTLSLAKGGFDLDKMSYLAQTGESVVLQPQNFYRYILPTLNGCGKSPADNAQNPVMITPAVLDFGQVRYADSPVKIPFTILYAFRN